MLYICVTYYSIVQLLDSVVVETIPLYESTLKEIQLPVYV